MEQVQQAIEYMEYSVKTAFTPTTVKAIFTSLFIIYSFTFDVSQTKVYLALLLLILLDFIFGILGSRHCGQKIRSDKVRHTAIKVTVYFSMIAGAHLAESGIYNLFGVLDDTVVAFLLVTELVSLLENIGKMGYDTPKGLIDKLIDYKNKQ